VSDPFGPDPWLSLRRLTPARIALGRAGGGQPTRALLDFSLAHARARDAVHTPLDVTMAEADILDSGVFGTRIAWSAAPDRATFLSRPDLGRKLAPESRLVLAASQKQSCDLAFVVADGLSAAAVQTHASGLLEAMIPSIERGGWRVGPVVIATQARVALGDEIGQILGARAVAVLIGERPGLSSPDSLGVYLTFDPRPGRADAERNCISNIRADGLSYDEAAFKLAWLIGEAFRLRLTGVALKDESDLARLALNPRPALGGARVQEDGRSDMAAPATSLITGPISSCSTRSA
jgi:ethanolamine ammonia-lyase small subunit